MNTMPVTAPMEAATMELRTPAATRGCLTGVALDDVRRLCLPPCADAFGYIRPPLDHTALEMSLELSYMTYTLDLEPWMRSGWTDMSIQVDNRLESGVTVDESESATSERIRGMMNAWKVARARMALRSRNPVAQVMGALRQRDKSDTIKAVTMIHPAAAGRFVVAIGFMGTGSRFYDWFSNFRFTTEDGFHKGFYQLTQSFERSANRIRFPAVAASLGLPSLTLSDVLEEMRKPDSRFSLWMAGHSQGGAVMQVFCHRVLTGWGVLPRHVVGYGFASPTTSPGATGRDTAAYPLYHIINTDDLVPRIGALKHLGLCLQYRADDALRDAAYGWVSDPDAVALRKTAEALFEPITDTPTMLQSLAALCETVQVEKTEETLNALLEKRWSIAPLDWAFTYAGGKAKATLSRMARYARVAYWSLMGRRMDENEVNRLRETMRPVIRELPMRKILEALGERYHPPHMLCRAHQQAGAYGYIVRQGWAKLGLFIWVEQVGTPPQPLYAKGFATFIPDLAPVTVRQKRDMSRPHGMARPSARTRGFGVRRAQRFKGGVGVHSNRSREHWRTLIATAPRGWFRTARAGGWFRRPRGAQPRKAGNHPA